MTTDPEGPRGPRPDIPVPSDETSASPLEDAGKMGEVFREGSSWWQAEAERCRGNINPGSVTKAAVALGVSADSLDGLGIGFDSYAYTFPMVDADGGVIGLRKRAYSDLTKKHVAAGGHVGLFVPAAVTPANVQAVTEGETDVAAALTLGFAAIGTPGAGACAERVATFVSRRRNACPCIIGDNDAGGEAGAERIAEAVLSAGVPCHILIPPDPCYVGACQPVFRTGSGGRRSRAACYSIVRHPAEITQSVRLGRINLRGGLSAQGA